MPLVGTGRLESERLVFGLIAGWIPTIAAVAFLPFLSPKVEIARH
jgi:hypothetical protein